MPGPRVTRFSRPRRAHRRHERTGAQSKLIGMLRLLCASDVLCEPATPPSRENEHPSDVVRYPRPTNRLVQDHSSFSRALRACCTCCKRNPRGGERALTVYSADGLDLKKSECE